MHFVPCAKSSRDAMWSSHPDVACTGGVVGADKGGVVEPWPNFLEQADVGDGNSDGLLRPGLVPDAEEAALCFVRCECSITFKEEFIERTRGAGGKGRLR